MREVGTAVEAAQAAVRAAGQTNQGAAESTRAPKGFNNDGGNDTGGR